MLDKAVEFWPYLTAVVDVIVSLIVSGHVVLSKRDTRAAIAWVGLIWLCPILGSVLYLWLGINRIQKRARLLRRNRPHPQTTGSANQCPTRLLDQVLGSDGMHLKSLVKLIGEVTGQPLLHGNCVRPLVNGDVAYPAMTAAIDSAVHSVTLSTYIFDDDQSGDLFFHALERAHTRGVSIRVLVDDLGARYSYPPITKRLRQAGIPFARFLPAIIPWRLHYSNLRTHRKIMVVDGNVGFTGGMNIREGNCLELNSRYPVQDLHLRVTGPVVEQLQNVFAADWNFCTGELLQGDQWFQTNYSDGPVLARGLPDGPDEHFESFRLTLLGAVACAKTSILVVTPYFLPDAALITALNVAALRGISVDIVLPAQNNLPFIQWASTALLWQLLERGCRIWLSAPPFDHTKLLVIDGMASFIGSSNWDPRSLRLNFEFNLECYDRELAATLTELTLIKMQSSRQICLADVDGRSLPVRLRDGIARLCAPFL